MPTPANRTQSNPRNQIVDYEESREKRIKENLERMHKLGIMDLSLKLKSSSFSSINSNSSIKKPSSYRLSPLPPLLGPSRRSSRLLSATPVSYVEVHNAKKDMSYNDEDILLEEGVRPELYTERHEQLLGDCKMSWTLFKDGYGNDGKRIYDSYNGKTCHQCRQKTLGHRTECSQCNMIQGQFCGDCLYTRYGENVLEAKQDPNWICPVCRGICNCSLCRKAKGWAPTGYLYRKVSNLGFKSVAHYLIKTRQCLPEKSENNPDTIASVSAKKSLIFSDMEVNDGHLGTSKLQSEQEIENVIEGEDIKIEKKRSSKKQKCTPPRDSIGGRLKRRRKEEESNQGKELVAALNETMIVNKAMDIISFESEACSDIKPSLTLTEAVSPDSIAGRLRSRRKNKVD